MSLLIVIYQSKVISWSQVYLINVGYGNVFYSDKEIPNTSLLLYAIYRLHNQSKLWKYPYLWNFRGWTSQEDTGHCLWSLRNNWTFKPLRILGRKYWITPSEMWSNKTYLESVETRDVNH